MSAEPLIASIILAALGVGMIGIAVETLTGKWRVVLSLIGAVFVAPMIIRLWIAAIAG